MNPAAVPFVAPPESVLARAEVTSTDPEEFSRNAPSTYADPVAWLAVEAARRALADVPEVLAAREDTAVLAVSAHATIGTMHGIVRRIRAGRVSPLHFAGANPGLLAGAVCREWQLKGPSLTLTMPPAHGTDAALTVARGLLGRALAPYVLLLTHEADEAGHTAVCTVWGRQS
ncbi:MULTISPECIES: beta-ketoacyl synthase N-terminal-like domain-containing protein [Streptomyces]|uniref:Polyketide synthase n=1 Tax=Streptomyces morookaense TaxID=1970 RepID=A0A7Y7B1G3_STRMO|nr:MULTISPECIES: beta-ketoacyl synthase N-terminal-like domain-containing protein [Streptomyces]MCC2278695.1 polyketide synthase [Streptomyces sp. ET3-23]NVK77286.1 polyketide synthase [Streptomyces morookaense]GHF18072.1 hypothetical protein GCM10010359_19670 [Streptomyces morookaense]